jgi:hypothetical protein
MVIARKDAEKKLTESQEKQLADLEQRIDEKIRDTYGGGYIIIYLDRKETVDAKVKNRIKYAYENAGWDKLEFVSDQRDGEFIRLS